MVNGDTIGPYTILGKLGEGGMGEVYRARDSRLDRDVALKILPESFAGDSDRLMRFEREAKTLASLNHPGIAAIYGIESNALVMELIDGQDLSQCIARGPIPIDDALPIAKQIAEALEAAHDQGIVHRDLKPANIKVRDDGTVKVLDFGLAKAIEQGSGIPSTSLRAGGDQGSAANSPTITSPAMTLRGVILGTAAYMAPEQAKGKPVDRRADIWAFGCVLYEMLTGERAFTGNDVTDIITSVIRDTPDWNALPPATPASVRRLLRRCLEKDARQRVGHLSIVRLEIDDAVATEIAAPPSAAAHRPSRREYAAWALAAILAVTAVVLIGRPSAAPAPGLPAGRFTLSLPTRLQSMNLTNAVPSPDGRFIALPVAGDAVYLRRMDQTDFTPIPDSNARAVAWTLDSKALLLGIANEIVRIEVAGAGRRTVARLEADQSFIFDIAPHPGGALLAAVSGGPIHIARSEGAELVALGSLDAAKNEIEHREPVLFPDGRRYFYGSVRRIVLESEQTYYRSVDGGEERLLSGFEGRILWAGTHLVFRRDDRLFAQRINYETVTLEGEPMELADQAVAPAYAPRQPGAAVAATAIAYRTGREALQQFTWVGRDGRSLGTVGPPAFYPTFDLSNDGSKIVAARRELRAMNVWVIDAVTGTINRVTAGSTRFADPRFSGDGRQVVIGSESDLKRSPHRVPATGGEPTRLFEYTGRLYSNDDWSADGRWLLYHDAFAPMLQASDLNNPSAPPITVVKGLSGIIDQASLSRDGRWVAYQSNESGQTEIYVAAFPPTGDRWQVSVGGGVQPTWRADGRELYYLKNDASLMSVAVTAGPPFAAGAPVKLFSAPLIRVLPSTEQYAAGPDGSRFLFAVIEMQGPDFSLEVLTNWMSLLSRPGR
jgi:predicted Ser/Thr protein kinase